MKKIVSLFCTLSLLMLSSLPFASAETALDLQGMSTDELVSLRNAINNELASRDFEEKEVSVPTGTYTIGVDIPAGTYTLSKTGAMPALVTTYTAAGDIDLSYSVTASEPVGKLSLEEGQTIEISIESVVFAPYKGLGF